MRRWLPENQGLDLRQEHNYVGALASRTVKHKCLFKPPSLWYSVTAAFTKTLEFHCMDMPQFVYPFARR